MAPVQRRASAPRPTLAIDASSAVWKRGGTAASPLVVFLHGFGGDEHDWTPHFDLIPDGIDAVALRGPVALGDRWAWVHFGEAGLGAFSAAARGVLVWLDALDAPNERPVALVGWSQGAAMAIHLARQRPHRFATVVMGGGFVWELRDHQGLRSRRLPVWFGIGDSDEVIPKRMVGSARRWLQRTTEVTTVDYPGETHRLTREIAADAIGFAVRQLTP